MNTGIPWEGVLTQYIGHNDNKFDYYHYGNEQRKHIVINNIPHDIDRSS
jgi:hypothetical protein